MSIGWVLVLVGVAFVLGVSLSGWKNRKPVPPIPLLPTPRPVPESRVVPQARGPLPSDLTLTGEFKNALAIMEEGSGSLLVTGGAGTGKSTLLRLFRERTDKNVAVVAPTGIAALQVKGATIHSFFGFAPRLIQRRTVRPNDSKRELFRNLDVLIIDEVSMVRADLLDGVDHALRLSRKDSRPFGGARIFFFGDPFQLPPVVEEDNRDWFDNTFGGEFFFHAPGFAEANVQCLELTRVFRQDEASFIAALNAVRRGIPTSNDLALFNTRVAVSPMPDGPVTLTTTRVLAESVNRRSLAALPGRGSLYRAVLTGSFVGSNRSNFPAPCELRVKTGARVMMLQNDPGKRWVNGTQGTVHALSKGYLSITMPGGTHDVYPHRWEKIAYMLDKETGVLREKVTGVFEQIPVDLAWAATIHKCQGMTLDSVHINMGLGAFADGQAYVALSRCRTLSGLTLEQAVGAGCIRVSPAVRKFMDALY